MHTVQVTEYLTMMTIMKAVIWNCKIAICLRKKGVSLSGVQICLDAIAMVFMQECLDNVSFLFQFKLGICSLLSYDIYLLGFNFQDVFGNSIWPVEFLDNVLKCQNLKRFVVFQRVYINPCAVFDVVFLYLICMQFQVVISH